jgi:hypothetical protein
MAQVIRLVEATPADQWPTWWADGVMDLRVAAALNDFGINLDGVVGRGGAA